jgi:murein DD-endopeptidase MepM/ murein hydrolase activator NlpD
MEKDYYNAPEDESLQKDASPLNSPLKMDPHIKIFILQGAICIGVILFCFVIKFFFGGFFGEVKEWYFERFNEDTSPSLVLGNNGAESGVGGPEITENSNNLNQFSPPIAGILTSSYGYRLDPFTNEPAIHNGVDIATKSGTPIKAVFNGEVEISENSGGDYGKYIVINHGGFKTLYAHCESLIARVGKNVVAGDVIATVGSTGRATGPHLHFEIKIGDVRIDPTPFINTENK